jgi:hypothetical protein
MIIDEKEISEARNSWGEGLIAISNAFESGGIEIAIRPSPQELRASEISFSSIIILHKNLCTN